MTHLRPIPTPIAAGEFGSELQALAGQPLSDAAVAEAARNLTGFLSLLREIDRGLKN